jgi:hypothetical protein
MFLVWSGPSLRGIYKTREIADAVARAITGASHITQQRVSAGCVFPATHWWFL